MMLDISTILLKRVSSVWYKEILHMGHKNKAHIQLLLLHHIQPYTELYLSAN